MANGLSNDKTHPFCSICFGQRWTLLSYQPSNLDLNIETLYLLSIETIILPSGLRQSKSSVGGIQSYILIFNEQLFFLNRNNAFFFINTKSAPTSADMYQKKKGEKTTWTEPEKKDDTHTFVLENKKNFRIN